MTIVPISNVGMLGVWKDRPAPEIPPEAWTASNNFRFYKRNAIRILGHSQVLGTPSITPGFLMNVPSTDATFWLYANLSRVKVYDSGVETDITRTSGAYNATDYRSWNGCILGGIPILNNYVDIPQYWQGNSPGYTLADIAAWPTSLRAKVIRNYGQFLVTMNLSDGGARLPHAVRWSDRADPGALPRTWDLSDATALAGQFQLTDVEGGEIVEALLYSNSLIIYKENSTHIMSFIGGNDVMAPALLFTTGILAPRCAALIDSGRSHFVVTQDDVITHSGTRDVTYPLAEKDKDFLFSDMDVTTRMNSFAFNNPAYREVWFAYPSTGNTYPNKVMIYSYMNQSVAFRDFSGITASYGAYTDSTGTAWNSLSGTWDEQVKTWSTAGGRKLLFGQQSDSLVYALDSGYAFGASAPTATLERTGLAIIGKDRTGQPMVDYNSRKLVDRIWPKIRGSATVNVYLGAQEELDGTVVWTAPKTFSPSQKYLDFNEAGCVGRLNAVKFESTDNVAWQLEGYDLNVTIVSQL